MRAMPPPPAVDHSAVPVPLEPFDLDSAPQEDLDPELQPAVLVEEPIASTAKLGVHAESKIMLEHVRFSDMGLNFFKLPGIHLI